MDRDLEYDISDSDEYEKEDKILLDDLKKRKIYSVDQDDIYGVGSDEDDDVDEDEEEVSDIDMGSDLEDRDDKLPDDRAWGQRRKHFYNTDYVDQDYAGTLGAEDEEAAKLEEQEARNIQKRLIEQLNDSDFTLVDIADTALSAAETKAEAIQTDLSQLSKRQKIDLFMKEAPEFSNLVADFLEKLTDAKERLVPILNLVKEGKLVKSPAADFIETKFHLILKQLLIQLQPIDDTVIAPQVNKILEALKANESEPEDEKFRSGKGKKLLKILKKLAPVEHNSDLNENSDDDCQSEKEKEAHTGETAIKDESAVLDSEADDTIAEKQGKRAITYEMAKNKGLTPKRSKEQRNPRVKHRNKFRKAKIRRRGQVRTPRTEIPVYGGEPTGIKIGLKKGRKLM